MNASSDPSTLRCRLHANEACLTLPPPAPKIALFSSGGSRPEATCKLQGSKAGFAGAFMATKDSPGSLRFDEAVPAGQAGLGKRRFEGDAKPFSSRLPGGGRRKD